MLRGPLSIYWTVKSTVTVREPNTSQMTQVIDYLLLEACSIKSWPRVIQ